MEFMPAFTFQVLGGTFLLGFDKIDLTDTTFGLMTAGFKTLFGCNCTLHRLISFILSFDWAKLFAEIGLAAAFIDIFSSSLTEISFFSAAGLET